MSRSELIDFIRSVDNQNFNSSDKFKSLIKLQEYARKLSSKIFELKYSIISNKKIYFIESKTEKLTEPVEDLILAETYRRNNKLSSLHYIDLNYFLSEIDIPLLGMGSELGLTVKPKPNRTGIERIRSRVIRICSALGLISKNLLFGQRAEVWEYIFPNNYYPENNPEMNTRIIKTQNCSHESKSEEYTTQYIMEKIEVQAREQEMQIKPGDIIRDLKTQKLYLINFDLKIESLIPNPLNHKHWCVSFEYKFPQFPIGYWSGIIPFSQVWWCDFTYDIEFLLEKLRGPVELEDNEDNEEDNEGNKKVEYRTYLISQGQRFNLAIKINPIFSEQDIEKINQILNSTLVKIHLRSDGYFEIF